MTWFKVDDGFAFHPKAGAAGNAAIGLWVRAGSWSAQQLTDGEIPRDFLKPLGAKPRDAAVLVEVGLWDVTDTGWRFHDWSEFQPSREQVRAERASGAARQKVARSPELRDAVRERDGDFCRYCGHAVLWTDRRGAFGATYDHVDPVGPSALDNLVVCCRGCNSAKGRRTPEQAGMALIQLRPKSDLSPSNGADPDVTRPPTRPDPTRPSSYGGGSEPRKRSAQRPSSWAPNLKHHDMAAQLELKLEEEVEKFTDYHDSKGSAFKDWDAAFRTWLRNAAKWGKSSRNPYGKQRETDDLFDAAYQRALIADQNQQELSS